MRDVVLVCVPIILTAVSGYLTWVAQQLYSKKDIGNKAVKVLMRKELRMIHTHCMKKGSASAEEIGEFNEIYDIYHAAGGNGTATVWKHDMEKLRRE